MATSKKTHPADAVDLAAIAKATEFTVTLFRGAGKFDRAEADSLEVARRRALELQTAAGPRARKAMVHAIINGKAFPVPASFNANGRGGVESVMRAVGGTGKLLPVPAKADPAKAKAAPAAKAPAKPAKAAKAEKAAPARKAAKPAKATKAAPARKAANGAPKAGTKSAKVFAMLMKGATRAAIVE